MKTPAILNQLLQKEMDRKSFLQHTAAITLLVSGSGIILQSLIKGAGLNRSKTQSVLPSGYGASAYGGVAQSAQIKR